MAQKLLTSSQDNAAHDTLQKAKERQAANYNQNVKERPRLNVGDTVRTRWNKDEPWEKAEVTKVLPHHSYQLRREDGTLHSHQLSSETISTPPVCHIKDQ